MAFTQEWRLAIPLFMVHQAIVPLLVFNLDVFMEEMIGDEEHSTGGKRGLFLGIGSIAYAIAPLTAGFLMGEQEAFEYVYLAGALLMLPFIYLIVRYFKVFTDPVYAEIKVLPAIHSFWAQKDIRYVFLAHFLLQLFFAFMVIYTPLYLANVVGFTWTQIGLVLFVGLLAYVFLEYPIGVIADRYLGEKEMMAFGFVILAVSTSWFVWLSGATLTAWMVVMFMTRVGASLVEATTESYFFKHIDGSDANIISFFRITRPLAIVAGALLGSFCLLYMPLNLLFVVVGFFMVPGLFFTMMLKDTK
jgi:MFS family permease